MAVASKSPVSARRRKLPSRAPSGKTVPILPSSQSTPLWLLRLCVWQRRSSVVTFVLVVTTLTIYAWTAYSQQMWSQAYRKLLSLQSEERQLTTTNEVLKNKMALQAEQPGTGLVPPNPGNTIFLTSAPQSPAANSVVPTTKPSAQQQQKSLSLGY